MQLVIATLTPFMKMGDVVDGGALRDYLAFLYGAGVRTILALGTTGEFYSMSDRSRAHALVLFREHWKGKLLANVSHTSIETAISLARHAESVRADGVVVLPPYYFHSAAPAGVMEFMTGVASATTLPVWLYHFPRHSGIVLTTAHVTSMVRKCPNIVGLKDSSGNLRFPRRVKVDCRRLQVLTGSDTLAIRAVKNPIALDGWVSGGSNPFPHTAVKLAEYAAQRAWRQLVPSRQLLGEWSRIMHGSRGEISALKVAVGCSLPDFPDRVLPPLVPVSDPLRVRSAVMRLTEQMES